MLILFISLFVIYVIGKYIAASNKDKNNKTTSKFGDDLAEFAKSAGCIIGGVVIAIIAGGVLLILNFLFGQSNF